MTEQACLRKVLQVGLAKIEPSATNSKGCTNEWAVQQEWHLQRKRAASKDLSAFAKKILDSGHTTAAEEQVQIVNSKG